jgi:myo-inositol-1(or 4)-monophosphatase
MNDEYLNFAKELAEEAGRIMKRYFLAEEMGLEVKSDNTPVTLADKEINDLVINRVKARFPNHGVLGEEDGFGLDRGSLWVVDPLDGTPFFARGIPVFVFSMAYVEKGEPLVGVIFDPNTKRLTTAVKGDGAYENGKKLDISDHNPDSTLVISSWVSGEGHQSCIDNREIDGKLAYAYGQAGNILPFDFAIAHALMLVAAGRLDGCVTSVRNPWDVAAGCLIAKEAGAKVTDLFGNEIKRWDQDVKGLIAAAPKVYSQLYEAIRPVMEGFK